MAKKPTKEPTFVAARTPGERIRAAYLAKGYNRHSLSKKLGVAYTTIIAWEEDRSTPKRHNLRALADVVGQSPSALLGEDEPMTEAQYEEWGRFLETPGGKSMAKHERVALGSMRFAEDDPPTVERYQALLIALRGTRKV